MVIVWWEEEERDLWAGVDGIGRRERKKNAGDCIHSSTTVSANIMFAYRYLSAVYTVNFSTHQAIIVPTQKPHHDWYSESNRIEFYRAFYRWLGRGILGENVVLRFFGIWIWI